MRGEAGGGGSCCSSRRSRRTLDGPAGVHGVLDQAAVGVAQVAELHGLRARARRRRARPRRRRARRRLVRSRSSRSARRRGATTQRADDPRPAARRRRSRCWRSTRRPTRATAGTTYGRVVGARFDGHPWTQEVDLEVVEPEHPATRHLGEHVALARRGVPVPRPASRRARPAPRPRGAARPRRAGREAARLRLPARVVLRARARVASRRRASATSPARGRARPTCSTSPARLAWALGDGVSVSTAQVRNFSPWAYWMLRLEASEPRDPCPVDATPTEIPAWRERARVAADRAARPDARRGAARPRGARVGRLRHLPTRTRSCSTASRRCRCPRTSWCPTTATSAGPAVLAQHGHGPGKSEVCGLDDDDSRGGDRRAPRRLRARSSPSAATWCSRPICAASVNAPTGTRPTSTVRPQPRARRRPRARTRSRRTSGISRARSTCSSSTRSSTRTRIGMVGLSYGGTMTLFLAALDERVRCSRRERVLQHLARLPPRAVEPVRLAGAARHAHGARPRRPRRARRAPPAARRDRHRGPDLPGRRCARRPWASSRACTARSARRRCAASTTCSTAGTAGTATLVLPFLGPAARAPR